MFVYKRSKKIIDNKSGFTMVELLISIFIISILTITVNTFSRDIFYLNTSLSGSMNTQLDARHLIKNMVAELRRTSTSSTGAYPIESASDTSVVFYSDLDSNGIKEKVRYFQTGSLVQKGVIVPTGTPLTYNSANETVTTLASSVVSSSTLPLFQYYPSTYTGNSTPLSSPIDISSIRLIRINIIIDKDPSHPLIPVIVTSQVSLRNLKDNL